ncbi:MAG: hypothetical protein NTX79_08300 [Candidatus Micrarchaeota archaeon]|nr:hypothetical protein [Candidatus Micrarchaeota archaeon]
MFIFQKTASLGAVAGVSESIFTQMLWDTSNKEYRNDFWLNKNIPNLSPEQLRRFGEALCNGAANYSDPTMREPRLLDSEKYLKKALELAGKASDDGRYENALAVTYYQLGLLYTAPETKTIDMLSAVPIDKSKIYDYPKGIGYFKASAEQYKISYEKKERREFLSQEDLFLSQINIARTCLNMGNAQNAGNGEDAKESAMASYGNALDACKKAGEHLADLRKAFGPDEGALLESNLKEAMGEINEKISALEKK